MLLESTGSDGQAFLHVAQSEVSKVFQGVAILNPNNEETTVLLQVWDEFGDIAAVRELTLPGMSRVSGLLTDSVFFGAGFEQVKGHIRIFSTAPVISYSLFGGEHFLAAVQGQPLFQ